MEEIKNKISDSLKRWNYEVSCETFNNLNYTQVKNIAVLYDLDTSKTQMELCNELVEILKKIVSDRTEKTKMCLNEEDPISGDSISSIDKREMMTIEQNGKIYCFSIDNIYQYTKDYENKNPYTNVPFTESQLSIIQKEHDRLIQLRGSTQAEERPMNLSAAVATLTGRLSYASDDMFLNATEEQLQEFFETVEKYTDLEFGDFQNTSEFKINSVYKIVDYLNEGGEAFKIQHIWNYIIEKDENYAINTSEERDTNVSNGLLLKSAIIAGRLDIVKFIVETGTDVNIQDWMFLSKAIENGHLDIVKFLVESGTDVNDYSYLPKAIEVNNLDIVKFLVESGANVKDSYLPEAIQVNNLDIVKFLVESGADVNANDSYVFIKAFMSNNTEILNFLLENGASNYSKLVLACISGDLDNVKSLIQAENDIDYDSLLYNTITYGKGDVINIINILIKSGGDMVDSTQLLYHSFMAGKEDIIINAFLNKEIEIEIDINDILRKAIQFSRSDVVKILVKKGAVLTQDLLKLAVSRHGLDIVKFIVDSGIQLNSQILNAAIENADLDIIKYLIEKLDYVDLKEVLNLAAKNGHLEVVKYLVEIGADLKTIPEGIIENILNEGYTELVDYIIRERRA